MKRAVLLAALALLASPQAVRAADYDITIGPVGLSLGMQRANVLATTGQYFTVTQSRHSPDSYVLTEKRGEIYEYRGMLAFEGDRLAAVSKGWGSHYDTAASELASDIMSMMMQFTNGEPTAATVTARVVSRQPGRTISEIRISTRARAVTILVVESRTEGNQVTLSEHLPDGRK